MDLAHALARVAVLLPAERWRLALVAQGAAGVGMALDELQEPDLVGLRSARRQPLKARMAEIQKRRAGASEETQEALLAEKSRLVRRMAGL